MSLYSSRHSLVRPVLVMDLQAASGMTERIPFKVYAAARAAAEFSRPVPNSGCRALPPGKEWNRLKDAEQGKDVSASMQEGRSQMISSFAGSPAERKPHCMKVCKDGCCISKS